MDLPPEQVSIVRDIVLAVYGASLPKDEYELGDVSDYLNDACNAVAKLDIEAFKAWADSHAVRCET